MDHAEKLLRKVVPKHRAQILRALMCLKDPACRLTLQIEKLRGTDSLFKIYVGRYRVIFLIDNTDVHLYDIRLRNEKTYRGI